MIKKRIAYTTAGVVCAGALIFTLANREIIYEHFPVLSNLLNLKFNNGNAQEATLAAQQAQTMEAADKAIAAAEAALAASDAQEAEEETHLKDKSTWVVSSNEEVKPTTKLNEAVKVFSAVKVNEHPIHLPAEGEQIVLPMLNGQSVKVNVESTQTSEAGDYVWSGHLEGYSNDYPIVMTYGADSTYATITTPEGIYSMEATHGEGWLYKNPSEIELSKPNVTDYLEPKI